jgi:hypothetical protein
MNIGDKFKGVEGGNFQFYTVAIADIYKDGIEAIIMDCEYDEDEIGEQLVLEKAEFEQEFVSVNAPVIELKSGQTITVKETNAVYASSADINLALLLGII